MNLFSVDDQNENIINKSIYWVVPRDPYPTNRENFHHPGREGGGESSRLFEICIKCLRGGVGYCKFPLWGVWIFYGTTHYTQRYFLVAFL